MIPSAGRPDRVHALAHRQVRLRVQVPVAVEGEAHRGMAGPGCDLLRVGPAAIHSATAVCRRLMPGADLRPSRWEPRSPTTPRVEDLAGRCWHARPPAASAPPTNSAPPEPATAGDLHAWPSSLAQPLAPGGLGPCHGVHRAPGPRAGQTARPGNRAGPGRACGQVPGQGQPGRGRGPAPAAELDGRGWQRPLGRRGRGRGAGAEPSLGDGDHDQGVAQHEPVASSTRRCWLRR
jgi:hypothetical protein